MYIQVWTDLQNTDLLILHCTLKTKEAWMTVLTVETEEFPWNLDIWWMFDPIPSENTVEPNEAADITGRTETNIELLSGVFF